MKMHKNNLVKRGFAVLLALALVVGMMPVMALAGNDGTQGHDMNADCNKCSHGNINNHMPANTEGKCPCCGRQIGEPTTPVETPKPTAPSTETPDPTTPTEHIHNYTANVTKEATCLEAGVKTFTCVCEDFYTEEYGPLGHDFDGAYVEAMTATGGLGHAQKCQNEGCTKLSMVTPHKLTTTTNDAACGKPGSVVEKCTVCSYTSTKVLPELKHKWTIHDKKPPTCTENGFDNVYCQYCGMKSATASQIFLSKGHKYNDWQVDVLGYLTHSHTCEVCGEKETSEHNFTEWKVTSEDEVSKVEFRTCVDCGYKETKTTSKVCRHPATETRKEHKDATCVTAGYDVTICGVCGTEVERNDIPAVGHTYDAWTDNGEENHIHTCVNEGCTAGTEGHAVTAAHDFSEWETTAYPTYGIPGREERACATCGREESREIPALVGPPVIPPPVVVPDEPDEPVVDPDVPLGPGPEEPDEPVDEPDVPLDPGPEEPDEPVDEPDVPLDPGPVEPDEPVDEPDVPLDPGPAEPDEPDSTGGLDEEEIEDEEVPLADVPKTSDDLSLLWVLLLAASATLTAMRFTRRKRAR